MNKSSGLLLQVVLFILFVALATVDGWGRGCSWSRCYGGAGTQCAPISWGGCPASCSYEPNKALGNCNSAVEVRWGDKASCGYNTSGYTLFHYIDGLFCDDNCARDSVQCINGGGTWTNTGASTCDGKSCKFSNCLQSDTLWLNDSKAACDAIGGENNYAITDIDETCVHSGICCPPDSALVGNTCKWRCDSLYAACNAKNGYLYVGVLQDTTISGSDSTFTNKCYYNCSYAYNKDSTTSVTDGNTACSSPSTPIADCTRMPNDFSSVRTTYGDSVYSYDFLTPGSAAYIDSIVLTPCSRFMYRCTVNGKYKYWYSDADIPTGCTNIVKIK